MGQDKEKGDGIGFLRSMSTLMSRLKLGSPGLQYGGLRDLYAVFGYKTQLSEADFRLKYIRQDVCSRVVDAPPSATWSSPPTMIDADKKLIDAWEKVVEDVNMWTTLYRVDRLARLGHYSLLFFGFNDTGKVERQASGVNELLYVKSYGERLVDQITLIGDTHDKRYGLPKTYKIKFDDPNRTSIVNGSTTVSGLNDQEVHHSRVVHVVDNPLEDEIFSTPIVEKVYNLLDDLLKVVGGTAETYWLTANRGMQADIDKDMDVDPKDAEDLSDEIDDYTHQLRRIIRTRGVKLKVLDSDTPSPEQTFNMQMALLSGTTGIPQRILLGAEAGQLASEQDRANWADRIEERRILLAEPIILNPTVTQLQAAGVLPKGEFKWEWPSAFLMSPLESSQVMAQKARAIGNMSRQTGNKTTMQITSVEEAREIINLEGGLPAAEVIDTEEDDPASSVRSIQDDGTTTGEEEEDTETSPNNNE